MSDSMKNLFPAQVSFVPGEQPSSTKLNNWSLQEKEAFTALADAIGNIWNRDNTFQDRAEDVHPLAFTNLSRAVGNLEMLNPGFIYGSTHTQYINPLTAGETEHVLDFWPDLPQDFTAQDLLNIVYATAPGAVMDPSVSLSLSHVKLSPQAMTAAGDWCVVGRVLYTVTPATGQSFIFDGIWKLHDLATSFSVIPNMIQVIQNSGLAVTKVIGATDTYYVLETPTYLYDYDGNPPHSTFEGLQIPLPKICRYNTDVLIPDGLLALWDMGSPPAYTTAKKVEGALFYGRSDNYSVVVKNVELEENNQRYILVCAAEGMAYALGRLRNLVMDLIEGSLKNISGIHGDLRRLRFTGKDIDGNDIPGYQVFGRSRVQNNDHPQYLHREGFDSNDAGALYNTMLGTILMASLSSTSNYLNLEANSNKIQFGNVDGPSIYYSQTQNDLIINGIPFKTDVYKQKINAADTAAGFLADKLTVEENSIFTLSTETDSTGKQTMKLSSSNDVFKTKVNSADATPGYLGDKILGGANIKVTEVELNGQRYIRLDYTQGTFTTVTITQSGTYTVPTGVAKLTVYYQGGGGAGGNGNNTLGGGGGGSGELLCKEVNVTGGQVIPVVIGAGGQPQPIPSSGGDGGSTSFNGGIAARGGHGGGAPDFSNGGQGGAAWGEEDPTGASNGQDGAVGYGGLGGVQMPSPIGRTNFYGSRGGAGVWGGGGGGGSYFGAGGNAGPMSAPGSNGGPGAGGGGGGRGNQNGGYGGNGIVLLTYYI